MKIINISFFFLLSIVTNLSAQITFSTAYQLDTQAVTMHPRTHFFSVLQSNKFIFVLGEHRKLTALPQQSYHSTSFVLTLNQMGQIVDKIEFEPMVSYNRMKFIDNDGLIIVMDYPSDSLLLIEIYPLSDTIIKKEKSILNSYYSLGFNRIFRTSDNHFLIPGVYIGSNGTRGEIYLKLDAAGNTVWQQNDMFFYPENRLGTNMIELSNGNYLSLGYRYYRSAHSHDYERQGYFRLLDTSGNITSTTFSDNNRLIGFGKVVEGSNGTVYILGSEGYQYPFGASYRVEDRGYICNYDLNGQLIWEYSLDNYYDRGNSIIQSNDGNIIVSGKKQKYFYNPINNTADSMLTYAFLLKLSSVDGTKIWERSIQVNNSDRRDINEFNQTIQATNGDFISVGTVENSWGNSARDRGWIVRTDSFGCIIPGCQLLDNTEKQKFESYNQVTLYPNPTTDLLIFEFEKSLKNGSIRIFNSLGQEVQTIHNVSIKEEVDFTNQQSGLYFYGLYEENILVKQGQFIKQ